MSSFDTRQLLSYLTSGKDPSHANFDVAFGERLHRMLQDAPGKISIYSGFRSPEHQKRLWDRALKKYGSANAARMWVAPPGKSRHNKGTAADLRYASPDMRKWAHKNAGKYGLHFRMGHEPWHIEPIPGWTPSAPASAIDMEGKGFKSAMARRMINASPEMSFKQLPKGRVRFSVDAPNMGMLDRIEQAVSPGRLRSATPIGLDRGVTPPPAMPAAPTMMAATPSPPSAPGGLGGMMNLLSSLGQSNQQETAVAQAEADRQNRLRWAYAQGYGQGLF